MIRLFPNALWIAVFLIIAIPFISTAQWNIGASLEIQDEHPENGVGFRIEREILQQVPLGILKLRGHFSYFEEDNYTGENNITYSNIKNYDYGVAVAGGFSVGLLMPYIGTGIGSATAEVHSAAAPSDDADTESSLFWNGFIGAEISPLPALRPFIEYRIQSSGSFNEVSNSINESKERLIFGISVAF